MKTIGSLFLLIWLSIPFYAQDFLQGNFDFSSSKESYITLNDSTEVVGFMDKIERNKGLIEKIVIKDKDGKKTTYMADQIHHMYIAPSKWEKFGKGMNNLDNFSELDKDRSLNSSHIKSGYALFEASEVMIKEEKKILLLQLLNPAYASKIRVYFDPLAKKTGTTSIGGYTLDGGDAKSYFVKKGDAVAFKLEKKNYEKEENNLFGDCKNYLKKLTDEKDLDWSDFSSHVYNYTTKCNE